MASFVNKNKFGVDTGPSESSVLLAVLPLVLLIILLPLVSFFICRSYIFVGILGLGEVLANVWAAAVAVLLLHILLGVFVYKAVNSSAPSPKKQD